MANEEEAVLSLSDLDSDTDFLGFDPDDLLVTESCKGSMATSQPVINSSKKNKKFDKGKKPAKGPAKA